MTLLVRQVVFIVISAWLVERQGRVRLLLLSNGGIAVAQALIGLSFSAGKVVWLALLGQCLLRECLPLRRILHQQRLRSVHGAEGGCRRE